MEVKHVLVTGSEGYIGAVLVQKLLNAGYMVTALDTCFYTTSLGKLEKRPYRLLQKDIRSVTQEDLLGIDAVVHLAALSNDPIGELDPSLTEEINYRATLHLAQQAKKTGVKRFLFSSSCSIYGIAEGGVVDETSPVNALTMYAKSKALAEQDLQKLANKNFYIGLMRNSTVYGFSPKFRNDLVVNNFVTCGLARNRIEVMSDGTPWRPLIDVRDLSDVFIAFLNAPQESNGQIINVGFDENNFQVKQLLESVQKYLPECKVIYTGQHGKDTRSYKVIFAKFLSLFPDIKQKWNLDRSVDDLVQQLRKYGYSADDFKNGTYTRLITLKNLLHTGRINKELYWKE